MAYTRVLTHERYGLFIGPESAISEWDGPSLADLQSLTNISEALKIDDTDFNIEASDQSDDRSFTDAAGAQSRSFNQASGNVEAFTPAPGDTGIAKTTRDILKTARTLLAHVQRPVAVATQPIAAGDEVNVFRVISDGGQHGGSDVSRTYGTNLVLQDDMLVNYIVPSSVPNPVVLTAVGGSPAVSVGEVLFLKAAYEGRNVTSGAVYTVDDPTKAEVTNHGAVIGKAAGTVEVTCTVPGSAAGTPLSITVGV